MSQASLFQHLFGPYRSPELPLSLTTYLLGLGSYTGKLGRSLSRWVAFYREAWGRRGHYRRPLDPCSRCMGKNSAETFGNVRSSGEHHGNGDGCGVEGELELGQSPRDRPSQKQPQQNPCYHVFCSCHSQSRAGIFSLEPRKAFPSPETSPFFFFLLLGHLSLGPDARLWGFLTVREDLPGFLCQIFEEVNFQVTLESAMEPPVGVLGYVKRETTGLWPS